MTLTVATDPGGTDPNEDWVGSTPNGLVVLDGVSAPAGTETGCSHGTTWYVEQLGGALLGQLATSQRSLKAMLSIAIKETAAAHADSCDLAHPGTPAAAVAILRSTDAEAEYLALADVTILLDSGRGTTAVTDDRVAAVAAAARAVTQRYPVGSPEHAQAVANLSRTQRTSRNHPGGYWVAASDPEAAEHALSGSQANVRRAALLTDGATRPMEWGLIGSNDLLDRLSTTGPKELIAWVRQLERSDPEGRRWPRYKRHDDATAAYLEVGDPTGRGE